ncbi:septum formation inhibitor-activating ATPase [Cryobacterium sp. 1639]|uniref:septum formation inhibitor-activating ATPase n=1 Tax=Cryobacterium inferilacus TaxID=2866629 RepID=UPI001C737EFA|nr:septum formation inhibitor-activating ATPase [Cryobacterium sp. 1639]MBX0300856.1 septum formation inhibitor-activating ATPase [Cryobacterium sp. 1639]
MTLLALALDRDTEDRLLADIVEHGHVIVARPANVRELLAAIDRHAPEALIVGATGGTLTAELLAASDSMGIRVVALAATDQERRYVAELGLHEVVSADADWPTIEAVLTMGPGVPLRIDDTPDPPAAAPDGAGARRPAEERPRTRRGNRAGRVRPEAEPEPVPEPRAQPEHNRWSRRRAAAPLEGAAADDAGMTDALAAGLTGTGTVIAVWGPAGAPGRTTLAINIAAEIAAAGHTVVLADVDTYSGSIAPSLGLLDEAPGFAAACRLAGADGLTRTEFERIAHRYTSPRGAFWVLTGIGQPSRWPELSAERVGGAISSLRRWVDYVVLDTGFSLESDEEISSDLFAPRRNAATLAALGSADRVVACGLADPVGMARFLRAWADLTEVITTNRVHVVMNRVRSSAVGLGAGTQVASSLRRFGGIEAAALVPHDQSALDTAVLTGRTLRDAAPRSPARLGILDLVRNDLLPLPEGEQAAHRRPWSRPAGWRRPASAT